MRRRRQVEWVEGRGEENERRKMWRGRHKEKIKDREGEKEMESW